MSYYIIQGGQKLSGEVKINSTKNSTVALLFASLLNKNTTILRNFPEIEETKRIIEVLSSIGVNFDWQKSKRQLTIIPPKKLELDKINYDSAAKTRSVLMSMGPLMHFFKEFKIPKSGGCKLGTRTVKPYYYALENFGRQVKSTANYYMVKRVEKFSRKNEIILYESGDTVTETVLMAAALHDQKTVIKYASANYQVQEMCFYLELLGVKIEGIGTTTLTVHGVKNIDKPVEYYLAEDPIDAMLFISLAAVTNSVLTIKGCPVEFLELELYKLEKMGFKYKILKSYYSKNGRTRLINIKTLPSNLIALSEKIDARPYPGLNLDNLPFFVPIATQAKGRTMIHDWAFENRAIYYSELSKLGANITLADPHRVFIDGPTKLLANDITCPPALRPAAIILVAMLAAQGKSILREIYGIHRGYENLELRLQSIGAKIKLINE